MSIDSKKLVVVLGATGAQGGSVAKYLLKHSSSLFNVRAITRDPQKPSAKLLSILGAEVVQGDFNSESSLKAAFAGAHVIFAITNFWDQMSLDIEVAQGLLVNRLAAEVSTLEHYIFSGLADGKQLEDGRFQNILPYNAKDLILKDLQTSHPKLWLKTTQIWVAAYWDNWVKYSVVFSPVREEDGTFVLSMPYSPKTWVPSSSPEDSGVVVDSIIKGGEAFFTKTVAIIGDMPTEEEKLKIWSKELDVKAEFRQVSGDERQKRMESDGLPPQLALASRELLEALPFEGPILTADGIIQAKDIIPKDYKLKSWSDYVKEENWSTIL